MKLHVVHAGFLKLDGGAMFGIVPKRMWEKLNPPDDKNLTTWAMRCLLIETADRKILIDTGLGDKFDDKFRSHFEPHGSENLVSSLENFSFSTDDITDVFLTHLHFDHCGGALKRSETGELEPTFPNARYWSNKRHYEWASKPNAREAASFLRENFTLLAERNLLNFIEEINGVEVFPNCFAYFTNGHTEAMMMLEVCMPNGQKVLFCADSMPSSYHIPMPYVMAYDLKPLETLKEKAQFLEKALVENTILFFEHDPKFECGKLRKDEKGRIVLDRAGALADFL
jgi:glyoxylase-like metal-dependent hydrolase (beta-lactamase superfamily II)